MTAPDPEIRNRHNAAVILDAVCAFFRSGFFFMIFGVGFLYFAYENGQRAHSAMTFILVVLGSAMVLFGTGTQASGDLSNDETIRKYKVQIAGGAGAMSLLIGYGLVAKGNDLKGIFRPERKIIVVTVAAASGESQVPVFLKEYIAEAFLGTTPIPIVHRDRVIDLYLPITGADLTKQTLPLTIQLTHRNPERRVAIAKLTAFWNGQFTVGKLNDDSGGYEFQRIEKEIQIELTENKIDLLKVGTALTGGGDNLIVPVEGF